MTSHHLVVFIGRDSAESLWFVLRLSSNSYRSCNAQQCCSSARYTNSIFFTGM